MGNFISGVLASLFATMISDMEHKFTQPEVKIISLNYNYNMKRLKIYVNIFTDLFIFVLILTSIAVYEVIKYVFTMGNVNGSSIGSTAVFGMIFVSSVLTPHLVELCINEIENLSDIKNNSNEKYKVFGWTRYAQSILMTIIFSTIIYSLCIPIKCREEANTLFTVIYLLMIFGVIFKFCWHWRALKNINIKQDVYLVNLQSYNIKFKIKNQNYAICLPLENNNLKIFVDKENFIYITIEGNGYKKYRKKDIELIASKKLTYNF